MAQNFIPVEYATGHAGWRFINVRDNERIRSEMETAALVWFGIAGGAFAFAVSLLFQRYVRKAPQAMQSRGSFAMFAAIMVLFAIGAVVAGIAANGG